MKPWQPGAPAIFVCMACLYKLADAPGPTECPVCHNIYVHWANHPLNLKDETPKEPPAVVS